MEERKVLSTVEEIKAISDPYRYKILNCFRNLGIPATVKQIAVKMGEVPAKVHYHVKKMEAVGILKLHHTEEINGIIAKFYELTAVTFDIHHEDGSAMTDALFLSETQKMITQVYADHRDTFLKVLAENKDQKDKIRGIFSTQEVYLTKSQADELEKYIKTFAEENRERDGDGEIKYHYFLSFFNME